VFTLAEEAGGRYARAFTWANYWFKNKTTYFGDWVVVEGADSLSAYFAAMARAVDALADKWKRDKGYVPQAYPQIARALRQISRAVTGTRIDLPVDKGYGLVTDGWFVVVGLIWGISNAAVAAYDTWQRTGSLGRGVACGIWVGTQSLLGLGIRVASGSTILGFVRSIGYGSGFNWFLDRVFHKPLCQGGIIDIALGWASNWFWNR